jgi:hypothetical protein|tara:strand:+ start:240 stop:422 length:183 start_codon:yes stop_codon:yes gene_type:complete
MLDDWKIPNENRYKSVTKELDNDEFKESNPEEQLNLIQLYALNELCEINERLQILIDRSN